MRAELVAHYVVFPCCAVCAVICVALLCLCVQSPSFPGCRSFGPRRVGGVDGHRIVESEFVRCRHHGECEIALATTETHPRTTRTIQREPKTAQAVSKPKGGIKERNSGRNEGQKKSIVSVSVQSRIGRRRQRPCCGASSSLQFGSVSSSFFFCSSSHHHIRSTKLCILTFSVLNFENMQPFPKVP